MDKVILVITLTFWIVGLVALYFGYRELKKKAAKHSN
jgi:hypothetical protein